MTMALEFFHVLVLGVLMATSRPVDITAAPRAVISFASGLVTRVITMPSAQENAWRAVCADRKRAAARAELAAVIRGAATASRS
jgi:hypothetical protein